MRTELQNPAAVCASAQHNDDRHHAALKVLKMKVFLHKCQNQSIFACYLATKLDTCWTKSGKGPAQLDAREMLQYPEKHEF